MPALFSARTAFFALLASMLLLCAAAPGAAIAEPEAIPLDRIPAQLEQARELARRAADAARPDSEVEAAREQIAVMRPQFEALRERLGAEEPMKASLRALENALDQVNALRRAVTTVQARLGRRASDLAGRRDALAASLAEWQATYELAVEREFPAELLDSIRGMQETLREAERRLAARQEEVLGLQGTLSGWGSLLDDRQAQLDAELMRARVELFRAEQPPIWRGEVSELSLVESRDAWRAEWRVLQGYLLARPGNAWAFLLVGVLLLATFGALSRKTRKWAAEKPDLEQTLSVFRHPLAAALVLAIIVGPWFYPDAPTVFREILGVLLVFPLLRVMLPLVAKSLRGALYALGGLYLLMGLNTLLAAGTVFDRYTLLLLAAVAAGSVAWIFRPSGPGTQLHAGAWWRIARFTARAAMVLLGIAVLANIAGLVSLANLLTHGVIGSAFAAIVLFTAITVIRGALVALLQTSLLQHLNLVRWHGGAIDQWLMRILPLLALLGWILTTARMFRIDDILGDTLRIVLLSSATIGTVKISLSDVLGFVIAIWLGLLISRFLRFVLSVDVFPRVTLPRGVAATISMLVNYFVLGIAAVLAIAAAGIQLDRLAIILGALTIGIGFGLQNIVNNFVSGLILAFERPVQSGDVVQFSSMFGRVSRIGVRSSTVRTFDGAEVIVPNANLISNEVTNWTLSDMRRRMEIMVGVAYGSNPREVLELLLNAAHSEERLLQTPAPSALFLGFGDSSLDFSLRAWTDDFDNFLAIKSDLTLAIHDALYANGIEIPFPQRDLHLRSVDPQAVARIGAVSAPPVGDSEGDHATQQAAAIGQDPPGGDRG